MVFSDYVQLNPDLSINKNGKVRKRKRIEIRRVDKEEEDSLTKLDTLVAP